MYLQNLFYFGHEVDDVGEWNSLALDDLVVVHQLDLSQFFECLVLTFVESEKKMFI